MGAGVRRQFAAILRRPDGDAVDVGCDHVPRLVEPRSIHGCSKSGESGSCPLLHFPYILVGTGLPGIPKFLLKTFHAGPKLRQSVVEQPSVVAVPGGALPGVRVKA